MKRMLGYCIALTGLLASSLTAAQDPAANPLLAERGHHRPLVMIAPQANDPDYRRLAIELDQPPNRTALEQRGMPLYTVIGGVGSRDGHPLTPYETAALMAALQSDGFGPLRVILIGRDGEPKMDIEGYLPSSQILDIADRIDTRR
ncbi:DUF4174 domain-containing protein [Halotalea alkalilenta]|uniref:DUF4174 domain-containing protein n=1 Tax=Halotalea alkalilenta TaxID=376489 RepID=UPI0004841E39|nr:DUF4174 domain-containing protein [Halotalea alkalilenta]